LIVRVNPYCLIADRFALIDILWQDWLFSLKKKRLVCKNASS
jgi:hypothetical protein